VNDQTDSQLQRACAEDRSEPAFAELVRRHVDFVYSAALHMVCPDDYENIKNDPQDLNDPPRLRSARRLLHNPSKASGPEFPGGCQS